MTTDAPTQEVPVEAPAETTQIATLDQFAALMTQWHEQAIASMKHLLVVPEGMEIMIEGEDSFKLEGEVLRGFRTGVQLCLSFTGNLPFTSTPVSDESQPD